ncbi:MAG: hypothetical protein NTW38_05730 [Candidatus Aminicenantes bacterium]|nr:hypothetical protein [Candidatus Aminicenantes bacterium]
MKRDLLELPYFSTPARENQLQNPGVGNTALIATEMGHMTDSRSGHSPAAALRTRGQFCFPSKVYKRILSVLSAHFTLM